MCPNKGGHISKISAIVIGIVAIVLGYVFENQNVAFMVGLAFAVAATAIPGLADVDALEGNDQPWSPVGGLVGL